MLVGRADHVLKFMRRKINGVFFVPLKELFPRLFFGEPKKAKLGSEPNGTIVSVTRFYMAFPDPLRTCAQKGDLT